MHFSPIAKQPFSQCGFLGIKLPDLRALALSFFSPLRGLFALEATIMNCGRKPASPSSEAQEIRQCS